MMEYREFVEVLMAEIKEETGLKTEFHESDEKMPQDSIWVYMSEDNSSFNIFRLFTVESYNQWISLSFAPVRAIEFGLWLNFTLTLSFLSMAVDS